MGAVNRGKQFENVVRKSFEKVPNTTVIRLPDPTNGYLGIRNISDFIVYHEPYQYFIECKSIHGRTFPLSNITKNQYDGMMIVSKCKGVIAGVLVWWVDADETWFFPIEYIAKLRAAGRKSIAVGKVTQFQDGPLRVDGKKRRVFYDYYMEQFFNACNYRVQHGTGVWHKE